MYNDEELIEIIRMNMEDFKNRNRIPKNFAELITQPVYPELAEATEQFNQKYCQNYESLHDFTDLVIKKADHLLQAVFKAEKLFLDYFYYCSRYHYYAVRKLNSPRGTKNPLDIKCPENLTLSYGKYCEIASLIQNIKENVLPAMNCSSTNIRNFNFMTMEQVDKWIKKGNTCQRMLTLSLASHIDKLVNTNEYVMTVSTAAKIAHKALLGNVSEKSIQQVLSKMVSDCVLKTPYSKGAYYPINILSKKLATHTWADPTENYSGNVADLLYIDKDRKNSDHWKDILITEGKRLTGNDKIYTYGQIIRKVKKEAKNYLKNNL